MTPVRRVDRPGEYAALEVSNGTPVASSYMADGGDAPPPSMLRRVHTLLRGRYLILAVLAVVFGAAAGYYKYQQWTPLYESHGQIRIAPIVPRVLYSVEDNGMMPAYEGFIDSQMALMKSSRVVDLAMQSEDWKKLGRPLSDSEVQSFKGGLRVRRSEGSQVVTLSFTDGDPEVARAAVRSVIPAYMEIYGEEDLKREEARLNVLEQRRVALTNELKSLQDRIHSIANEFGSDSLEQAYEFKLEEVHKIEARLRELSLKKSELEMLAAKIDDGTAPDPVDDWKPLDYIEIARQDIVMRDYVRQLQNLELERALAMSFRREAHPNVRALDRRVKDLTTQIEDYALVFNEGSVRAAAESSGDQGKTELERQQELLVSSMERIKKTLTEAEEETREFGRKDLQIKRLREDAVVVKQRLKETDTRLEMLNVERSLSVSGRVSIISRGDRPGGPVNLDDRTKQAAFAGIGGSACAAGLVLLWGFINRRHRYVEDADHLLDHAPLLGIIPELDINGESAERSEMAGVAINQMRALLQVGPIAAGQRVFAITSGSAGEGKTSVCSALGTSFANAGKRVLLVDFDMVGRGLSRRWPAPSSLSWDKALRDAGLSAQQVQEAKTAAAERSISTQQACLELGLAEPDVIESARQAVAASSRGLEDAIDGAELAFFDAIAPIAFQFAATASEHAVA